MKRHCVTLLLAALSLPCPAWSPRTHTLQTRLAKGLIPKAMARFLDGHEAVLLEAAGGIDNTQTPAPEDVEVQFLKVLRISEDKRPDREIIRELGRLGNMVQLLTDPSATGGFTFTRKVFSSFADEHIKKLVAVREPLFAAQGELSPRSALEVWSRVKHERHRILQRYVDTETGARIGAWDTLSVPFATMQLGFSSGVNATANLWILAWRAVGDNWALGKNSGE